MAFYFHFIFYSCGSFKYVLGTFFLYRIWGPSTLDVTAFPVVTQLVLTYLLTQWSRVLLEKLTGFQLATPDDDHEDGRKMLRM